MAVTDKFFQRTVSNCRTHKAARSESGAARIVNKANLNSEQALSVTTHYTRHNSRIEMYETLCIAREKKQPSRPPTLASLSLWRNARSRAPFLARIQEKLSRACAHFIGAIARLKKKNQNEAARKK